MLTTTVVVIGGGQAGLAVSRLLTELAIDHVVLERGEVAHRWRTRGWDSLTLLTPRWFSHLPHWRWAGADPHGYMSRSEVIGYLEDYAGSFAAPVAEHTEVLSVTGGLGHFVVSTTTGCWRADEVVLATGHNALPNVPDVASGLGDRVLQVAADDYRRPGDLPAGGVLVVGASASGAQIADELAGAGREVVLAVGHHTRVPRRYRGRDIVDWLSRTGAMDRPRATLPDPADPPHEPSMQLVGRDEVRELDLASLQAGGVVLAGRLTAADGDRVTFAPDLPTTTALADHRLRRLLGRIDAVADHLGAEPVRENVVRPARTEDAPVRLDLRARGISTVVWATGYRRAHPWLHLPVVDADGDVVHDAGRTDVPGLYVVGAAWQTRRSSALLGGVRHDAALVTADIAARHRVLVGADTLVGAEL
jgi:putative flavoprotein involved in K+ transport